MYRGYYSRLVSHQGKGIIFNIMLPILVRYKAFKLNKVSKKISDYVIEEWAKEKKMTLDEFIKWIKARPGWKKVKKFWRGLDNEV